MRIDRKIHNGQISIELMDPNGTFMGNFMGYLHVYNHT